MMYVYMYMFVCLHRFSLLSHSFSSTSFCTILKLPQKAEKSNRKLVLFEVPL